MKRPYTYVLSTLALAGCSASMCANEPLQADPSPDGETAAISFVRNCGATTGYSTHVSIVGKNGKLGNEPGNIFVVEGRVPVSVTWRSENLLVIDTAGSSEVFTGLAEFRGIKIRYR